MPQLKFVTVTRDGRRYAADGLGKKKKKTEREERMRASQHLSLYNGEINYILWAHKSRRREIFSDLSAPR